MTEPLLDILKICLTCAVVGVLLLFFLQRKLIYYPSKKPPVLDPYMSQFYKELRTKTKEGFELVHWYAKQKGPLVVIFHGNAGTLYDRAYKYDFLVSAGFSVLLAGYRGYGQNPGNPKEDDMLEDSARLLEWVFNDTSHRVQDSAVYGESLGSAVAVAMAVKYPFRQVILEGAPSSVLEVGQWAYPFLPVRWLLIDTWDSKTRIKKVRSPILFLHGKQDQVVPFRFGKSLYDAAVSKKDFLWMDDGGHEDLIDNSTVTQKILSTLSEAGKP